MTQPHLKDEIKELSRKFPPPNRSKLDRYGYRLDSMKAYYTEKIEVSGPGQAIVFTKFVHALVHASTLDKMYRNLTRKLAKLAEEEDK